MVRHVMVLRRCVVLELSDVWCGYAGGRGDALAGMSLYLRPGERVAVMGANGSGKTTLLRAACAQVVPSSGLVTVDGVALDWEDPASVRLVRERVGLCGQDPDDQMVASTVFEEVAFGPCNLGLPVSEVRERVADALLACRVDNLSTRDVATLSGGQRQRVALAGVVAMRPRYLLLDEPCSMLDGAARADVLRVVDGLADAGCGVLHVTHDLADALGYGRVLVMREGCLAWQGSPRSLLFDEEALAIACCHVSSWLMRARHLIEAGMLPEDAPLRDPVTCARMTRRAPVTTVSSTPSAGPATRGAPALDAAGGCLDATGEGLPHDAGRQAAARNEGPEAPALGEAMAGEHVAAGGMVDVRSVSYAYPDGTRALDDVSLSARAGEVTLILGRTGSGKSTLLRLLAGLDSPTSGTVRVNGSPAEPRLLGCSFQRAAEQLFAETVQEDVAFGPRNLGCAEREAFAWAREALGRVGLDPVVIGEVNPFQLSGGQMRRAALAGVLSMRTPFVAFDEPTVGLDAPGLADLLGVVRGLAGRGVGVIVVTHDVSSFLDVADQVVLLSEGAVVARGTARRVLGDAGVLARAGLRASDLTLFEEEARRVAAEGDADGGEGR